MRYLVTGCGGFVGSSLVDALLADGHLVTGVDCFTDYYDPSRKRLNLEGALASDAFELLEIDLAHTVLPDDALAVDGVFHQAAQAGVRASWGDEFSIYTDCNVLATQRLLEQIVQHASTAGSVPTPVVYASSSSVYGNAEARPTREDALPAPISPYGVTKLAAEHLCDTYRHEFAVPTTSLRYFTVYGPRQRPDMAFHKFGRAAILGQQIEVYGDGSASRDFTFITDIISGNRQAMEMMLDGSTGGTYNLGGGSTVTVREVLDMVGEILGRTLDVQYGPTQKGDVRHTSADTSSARKALGFEPLVDLRAGLERELKWLQSVYSVPAS